ncbi:MAG: nucleotidyltransferase family protein [Candidatus Lustribacter sp.]|jgi:hypothetical protein
MHAADAARIRGAVVDLALGDAAVAEHGMDALASGSPQDWETAVSLAAAWGVLYPVRRHLDEARLTPAARSALRQATLALAARSTFILHRSVAALRILGTAGVPYVAIKGVGLIAALDRPPATRATGDLDIIVREDDAENARRALMAAGFEEINPEYEQHMSDITLSSQLHNYARALRLDDFEVDLHWRMGLHPPAALAAGRLIDRAIVARAARQTILVADPVDGVLINVHHALRGSFDLHNTVRDLCDLRLWWEHGPIAARLDETIAAAVQSDLAPALLALWKTILDRDPAHGVRTGAERLAAALTPEQRAESTLMLQYVEEQIRHGRAAKFTLDLFNPGLYLREVFGKLLRIGHGTAKTPGAATAAAYHTERRPLMVRIADFLPRAHRVLNEVGRAGAVPAYRAVARAQRRFH